MATFVLIQSTVLTANTSSVTFSSIPQTFTDLQLLISARSTITSANVGFYDPFGMQFNATTSGYAMVELYGRGDTSTAQVGSATTFTAGTGATVGRFTETGINNNGSTANCFTTLCINIANYTSSTLNKTVQTLYVQEQNQNANNNGVNSAKWSNTAAITSIGCFVTGSFMPYSTFALYGIKNS